MRGTTERFLADSATIQRRNQTGTNALGEPIYDSVTIAEDVACAYEPSGTEQVREDSGERIQRPATIRFTPDADVVEGDRVTVAGIPDSFEVRELQRERDTRRDVTVGLVAEVERDG